MVKIDSDGNKLLIGQGGIYLKLIRERRQRQVFKIQSRHCEKYVSKGNIFKKIGGENGAIGFNHSALKILRDKLKINKISIRIGGQTPLHVKVKDIFKYGSFYRFLKEGFELQMFVPVDKLRELSK